MNIFLPLLAVFGIPFLVIKLEKKIKPIEWLSPVVTCYALGIILGNISYLRWDPSLARTLSEVSVMLAIPMLLFATDFPSWLKLARTTLISFVTLMICVMLMSYLAGLVFKGSSAEVWKMAGMLTGVYIGGTPNLTAIGKMLDISDEAFITINAVDVALAGPYLLIMMSLGVKFLTIVLRPFDHSLVQESEMDLINWKKLTTTMKIKHGLFLIILSGMSIGISLFLSKIITGEESAGLIIFGLTVIAISLSFIPKIRHFEGSQELGLYFLLAFCVSVGSMANIEELLTGKLWYFLMCAMVMIGSILLHFLCCFFLKIDRDTAIITSMAGIFGPAFVAPMSGVLKNKAILVSGITCGLVGIAVGNFLGLFVAWLLK